VPFPHFVSNACPRQSDELGEGRVRRAADHHRCTVLAEMADHQPTRLGPGGFAMMGGHMPHQFTCQSQFTCLMIVAFDRADDIYWGKGG
jgi:hypothetical protein